jgi:hypothetical protein
MTDELQEVQEEQQQPEAETTEATTDEVAKPMAEAEEDIETGGAPDPDATESADPGTEAEDVSTEESEES